VDRGRGSGRRSGGGLRRGSADAGRTRGSAIPLTEEQELSGLSFDERMALYKQKYDSSGAKPKPRNQGQGQGQGRQRGGCGSGGQGSAGDGRNASGRSAPARDGKGRNPLRKGGGRSGSDRKPASAEQRKPRGQAAEKAAPPKKGLLSKILGAFRKK